MTGCAAPNCEKPGRLHAGLCQMHYRRMRLHGDLNKTNRRTDRDGKGYRVAMESPGFDQWAHIVVAQRALGKPLPKGAEVHHVDEDKSNNAPCNLVVCPSNAYHQLLHVRTDALRACGNANFRRCCFCKVYDDPSNLSFIRGGRCYHKRCNASYQLKRRHGK
jgi:hypothetical protein